MFKLKSIRSVKKVTICALTFITFTVNANIVNLTTEYSKTPIGIDVQFPRFSWQMDALPGERNIFQTAYQVVVKDPIGNLCWDSGKIMNGYSVGVSYAGIPLKASTRYTWDVRVWDRKGNISTSSSWFETGLMNGSTGLQAWEGAEWIGGSDEDMVLYSQYLVIFNARYTTVIEPGSTRASFIYGANDSRLMDKYKNIWQVEKKRNESYIKIELDISGVDGSENGMARINIYRSGYTDSDTSGKPFRTFDIKTDFINKENRHSEHTIEFTSVFGQLSLTLDRSNSFMFVPPSSEIPTPQPGARPGFMGRQAGASVNLNPVGSGGNYIPFGMLCDIGFSAEAGQKASFSNVVISNNRFPNATLFTEDLSGNGYNGIYSRYASDPVSGMKISGGKYIIDGGSKGVLITADPGRNSTPMLRAGFKTAEKPVKDARLYVTARGIYEVFINGNRVGDDYYNPGLTQYNITHLYQTYYGPEYCRCSKDNNSKRNGRQENHFKVLRNAISKSEGVGKKRWNDYDRKLQGSPEPGCLYDEEWPSGLPAPVHFTRIPVH